MTVMVPAANVCLETAEALSNGSHRVAATTASDRTDMATVAACRLISSSSSRDNGFTSPPNAVPAPRPADVPARRCASRGHPGALTNGSTRTPRQPGIAGTRQVRLVGAEKPPLPRGDGEETPLAGHALQLVSATVYELES